MRSRSCPRGRSPIRTEGSNARVPGPGGPGARGDGRTRGYCKSALTTSDTAPGPGKSAEPSIRPLPVAGMQNTDPSVAVSGGPMVRFPAGEPVSLMLVAAPVPNAPGVVWPGQKLPPTSDLFATPVVSGFRTTANGERPGPNAMQSCDCPVSESGVHGAPAFAAVLSHVALPGGPTQNGQGSKTFEVTVTVEVSGTMPVKVPVVGL